MGAILSLSSELLKVNSIRLLVATWVFSFLQYNVKAQIIGPDTICYNQEYTFSLEKGGTASWTWEVQQCYTNLNIFTTSSELIGPDFSISSDSDNQESCQFVITALDWTGAEDFQKHVTIVPGYQDRLVFPYDICDEDGPEIYFEATNHLYNDKYVCVGDTTNIAIRYFTQEILLLATQPSQPFALDRIK